MILVAKLITEIDIIKSPKYEKHIEYKEKYIYF